MKTPGVRYKDRWPSWYGWMLMVWVMILAPVVGLAAEDCAGLADRIGHGGVMWTDRAVVVQGTAVPNVSDANRPLHIIKNLTRRAAMIDAYRKAAAILSGVRVSSTAMAGDDPRTEARINALIKNATVCKTKYFADGGIDVVVKVPLTGATALAPVSSKSSGPANAPSPFTGLVVDARDIGFVPALVPRLVDVRSRLMFDAGMVQEDVLNQARAVTYVYDTAAISPAMVGDRPHRTQALGPGTDSPSDLVVDEATARILAAGPRFLAEGRVVVVINPPTPIDCRSVADSVTDTHVDWNTRLILARGQGRVDFRQNADNAVRLRLMEQAAEVDAQRKLLAAAMALPVDGATTPGSRPDAAGRYHGLLLNAVRCGARYFQDGTAEVVVAVPMDAVASRATDLGSEMRMPRSQPVPTVPQSDYTGVIVDATGIKGFSLVVMPSLVDPAGQEVYGPGTVSSAYADHYGGAGYHERLADAKRDSRVGKTPLVVHAQAADLKVPGRLFLDSASVQALSALAQDSYLLWRGRLVIVTNQ